MWPLATQWMAVQLMVSLVVTVLSVVLPARARCQRALTWRGGTVLLDVRLHTCDGPANHWVVLCLDRGVIEALHLKKLSWHSMGSRVGLLDRVSAGAPEPGTNREWEKKERPTTSRRPSESGAAADLDGA